MDRLHCDFAGKLINKEGRFLDIIRMASYPRNEFACPILGAIAFIFCKLFFDEFHQFINRKSLKGVVYSALEKRALPFVKDSKKNPSTASYEKVRSLLLSNSGPHRCFNLQRFFQDHDLLKFIKGHMNGAMDRIYKICQRIHRLFEKGKTAPPGGRGLDTEGYPSFQVRF